MDRCLVFKAYRINDVPVMGSFMCVVISLQHQQGAQSLHRQLSPAPPSSSSISPPPAYTTNKKTLSFTFSPSEEPLARPVRVCEVLIG